MNLTEYQEWVRDFYKKRQWYDYPPFIRSNFLTEEVGELAQAIRKMEIGRDRPDEEIASQAEHLEYIKEELGDVFDNLLVLADLYQLGIGDILQSHREKLEKRFENQ